MNNRYTHDELAYLTKKLGHSPIMHNDHGKNNKIATAKIIKRYMKDYRNSPDLTSPVMDIEQYEDILSQCEKMVKPTKDEVVKIGKNTTYGLP